MKASIFYLLLSCALLLTGCAGVSGPLEGPRETLVEIVEMPAVPRRDLFRDVFVPLAEGTLSSQLAQFTPAVEEMGYAVRMDEGTLSVEDPEIPGVCVAADLCQSGSGEALAELRFVSGTDVKTSREAIVSGLSGRVGFYIQNGLWGERTQAASLEDLRVFLETGDIPREHVILGEYQASVRLQGDTYPLLVRYFQDSEYAYSYELTVLDQTIFSPGTLNFLPGSLHECLEIADLNGDGYDDILVALGQREGKNPRDCYVYLPVQGYAPVEGFAMLTNPRWSAALGRIVDRYEYGSQCMTERFRLEGTELVRTESLLRCDCENSEPVYYEYATVGGVSTPVHEGVPASQIDLDAWNQ